MRRLLVVSLVLLAHSATSAAAGPSFVKPDALFGPGSTLANKTAAVLAAVNAEERNIVASLGAKPNSTILAATLAAYKNLTSGNAVSVVAPGAVTTTPSGTLQCLVNADGLVAGLAGANGNFVCSSAADAVVSIPINDGFVSGFKISVAKRGPPYVGQLIIDVTPRSGGVPATCSCGSGGGVPVSLLSPLQSLALVNLRGGCVPAPPAAGRRRLAESDTVLDVGSIKIEVTTPPGDGVPTLQLNSLPVVGPLPTPTPTVSNSTANLASTAPTLVITGTGFDPAATTVQLSSGAASVTSATPTRLILTFTSPPSVGPLTAVVSSYDKTSGAPMQVATVVVVAVSPSTNNLATSATQLIITGMNFNPTASANVVQLNAGTATVTSATSTSITVSVSGLSAGPLTAVVNTYGGTSGAPEQVATVVNVAVSQNTANLASSATTLVVTGTGFNPNPADNSVVLNSGTAIVASASSTSLTLTLSGPLTLGPLTAVVYAYSGSSGTPVQVATVVASPQLLPSTAPLAASATTTTLVVNGIGFDPTAAGNTVTLTPSGTAVVTAATASSLTLAVSNLSVVGPLYCVVGAFGGSSGTPVQVATVYTPPHAYVANSGGNTVSACLVSGQTLTGCASVGPTFNGGPGGVAIVGGVAFVTVDSESKVVACTVSASGATFFDCMTATTAVPAPLAIALSGNAAFVASYATSSVYGCTRNGRLFTNCAPTGPGFSNPVAIAISGGYAFVTNAGYGNSTFGCSVSGTSLLNCAPTGSNFNSPAGLAVSGGFAFVGNNGINVVTSCSVNNGILSNCAPAASLSQAFGIAVANGVAFVTEFYGSSVVNACVVSSASLLNCAVTGSGFTNPIGITVAP